LGHAPRDTAGNTIRGHNLVHTGGHHALGPQRLAQAPEEDPRLSATLWGTLGLAPFGQNAVGKPIFKPSNTNPIIQETYTTQGGS